MFTSIELWLLLLIFRSLLHSRIGLVVDILIVALAIVYIMEKGSVVQVEVQWLWLPGYVLIALFVFLFSSWLTTSNYSGYLHKLIGSVRTQSVIVQSQVVLRASIIAFHEEVIWRVFFQSVISDVLDAPIAIIVVAIAFTFWHRQRVSGSVVKSFELLMFSLVLGVAFALSGDPLLVIVIHLLRNYFILVGSNGNKV